MQPSQKAKSKDLKITCQSNNSYNCVYCNSWVSIGLTDDQPNYFDVFVI